MTDNVDTHLSRVLQGDFDGNSLRALNVNGNAWFVAKDVCKILGHTNSRIAIKRLDDDEKDATVMPTSGGAQKVSIISESGLYSLIFTSSLPSAKRFRKWVTSEVLPSIRKTGGYAANKRNLLADLNNRLAEADAIEQQVAVIRINAKSQEHHRIASLLSRASSDEFKGKLGAFVVARDTSGAPIISKADVLELAKAARDASGNEFFVMSAFSPNAPYDYAWSNTYRGAQE